MASWEGGARGAAGGAALGAPLGPYGMAAGGLIGGALGLFGGGGDEDKADNEFRDVNRAQLGLPGYDQSMQQHGRLISLLQDQAAGRGPSTADMQMNRGLQASLAQQSALAQTARGNPAMAQRQAAINSGNTASQITSQGVLNRLLEQRQGQQMLGGALAGQLDVQKAQQLGALEAERARTSRFGALLGQAPTPSLSDQLLSSGSSVAAAYYGNRGR